MSSTRALAVLLVCAALIGCAAESPRTVGGRIHGLAAPGLVLTNGAGDRLEVVLNGPFAFPGDVPAGSSYEISVLTQPTDPVQICTVTAGSGTVGDAAVTDVLVDCVTPGIREFSVSRGLASVGDQVALTWSSSEATACTIDDEVVDLGSTAFGTADISVNADASLTFTCEAGGQTTARTVDIVVADEDWRQLSAGDTHTCAIKTDGRLFCWGWGSSGQLGNDSTAFLSLRPVQENTGAVDWVQVAAGGAHTCAIKTGGRLFCFGAGGRGGLGTGSREDVLVPVQELTGAGDWATVSTGGGHTCAIKTDGRLFCWGWNEHRQLGIAEPVADVLIPTQETTLASDWATVSAGDLHTCATKTDGRLFCWGRNLHGQLGDGSMEDVVAAITQEITAATDWAQVSAGRDHTCALKVGGQIFCWGDGGFGQLGNGSFVWTAVPVNEITAADDWTAVSVGGFHTCASKTDGRVFCWGYADAAQLGNNSTAHSAVPVQESTAGRDWAQVEAGGISHSCALKRDGRVLCWGRNRHYLGNNTTPEILVPTQELTRATDWAEVATANVRTCAITRSGRLFCWGWSYSGPDADLQGSAIVPVQEQSASADWAHLSISGQHVCAIKTDGRLFCWGANDNGLLGDGSLISTLDPVQEATGASDWAQVSVGGDHACAIKEDGRLFCWGAGKHGRLGVGSTTRSPVPVQEATGAADWARVSAGGQHTCAIKNDRRLFCWGAGERGRLGNASDSDQLVPAPVFGDGGWVQVSAGDLHTCAVKLDGRLFCWGSGRNGDLGTGSTDDSLVPAQERSGSINWAQVSAGSHYTCAIRMDASLLCWGSGHAGQLGNDSVADRLAPVLEHDRSHTWASVAAAANSLNPHTCAIRHGGRLFCWGSDEYGELAIGAPPGPIWPTD